MQAARWSYYTCLLTYVRCRRSSRDTVKCTKKGGILHRDARSMGVGTSRSKCPLVGTRETPYPKLASTQQEQADKQCGLLLGFFKRTPGPQGLHTELRGLPCIILTNSRICKMLKPLRGRQTPTPHGGRSFAPTSTVTCRTLSRAH